MTPALEQLVREAMELTGANKPSLMEEDAPILADQALVDQDSGYYLVGLIGGKDVGKSALVNALVGKNITAVTSHGAGTEMVIAYSHKSQEQSLRELLEREVSGQYKLILHDQPNLRRQVLLDLPDIDSKYASHLQVTRAMLRHMLYPVWVSSVEKYADLQPQQMLAKVAEGNTPANFVFCLTKADQLAGAAGWAPEKQQERVQGSGFGVQESAKSSSAAEAVVAKGQRAVPTPWGIDVEEPIDSSSSPNPERRILNSPQPAGSPLKGPDPLRELRDDYAVRVQRTLNLERPPKVYLVSSKAPEKFDMTALRDLVCRQRTDQAVRESKQLAAARQDRALIAWLEGQDLATRAARLEQLQRDAEELVGARIGSCLMERIIPRVVDDPGTKMAMADDILQERVARWPVVNLIHTLLAPLFLLVRNAVSRTASGMQGADLLVDACIKDCGESITTLVQSTFAQLRQQQPVVAALYGQNRLWETMPAEFAAGTLHRSLADAVQRQRVTAKDRLLSKRGGFAAPIRWILTLGALVWFPFVQPVLAIVLPQKDGHWTITRLAGVVVMVLGVDYLLRSATFLIVYFTAVWLALRWNTQRRVARLLARWKAADYPDPSVNLSTQAIDWMDELTSPLRAAHQRMQSLSQRVNDLQTATKAA
jgi:hypothetical protein